MAEGDDEENDGPGSFKTKDGEEDDDAADNAGEMELYDATIKMLRLLANLTIDKTVGQAVGSTNECISVSKSCCIE